MVFVSFFAHVELQSLFQIWILALYPRSVRDPATLSVFSALLASMPHRAAMDELLLRASHRARPPAPRRFLPLRRGGGTAGDLLPPPSDVLEVGTGELAVELTRLSLGLLRELPADVLVRGQMGDGGATELGQLRQRTERLSRWAASMVVGERLLKRRVQIFGKMVSVAARLVELRNLHDALAIVAGLHNPAVSRLRQTKVAAGENVGGLLSRLTALIRPPYQTLRQQLERWGAEEEAFLPPLEVLLVDMAKLDEVEPDTVSHPETPTLLLGNIWKTNLLGLWVARFVDGFADRLFDFEGHESVRSAAALARALPDCCDDDTLWGMSQRLEQSVGQ